MILRGPELDALTTAMRRSPVTALLGPRQCGKTTLARAFAKAQEHTWFDLEDPASLRSLEQPALALKDLKGLVVVDEVQRAPHLFPYLRVLADRPDPSVARFLLLGSASPDLLRHTSESLAGRIEFIELGGFSLDEVGSPHLDTLWNRGGFPRSFLAESDDDSWAWRENFVRTFLERDLPQLGVGIAAPTLRRFWTMLAHYHGQTWNGAELGRAMGVSAKTVAHYVDLLASTFVVRTLQPWFANVSKRQVKAPKVYVRDSGLLHLLLGIDSRKALLAHPKLGASWEGFALEHAIRWGGGDPYFWATHNGAELDLLLMRRRERIGIELKHTDAPALSTSMRVALSDLELDRLLVVYPGERSYALDEKTQVVPLSQLEDALRAT